MSGTGAGICGINTSRTLSKSMEPELVRIVSRFGTEDAVKTLSAVVARGSQERGLKPRLAGEVSAEAVCVYRRRPFARNGSYPRFIGSFVSDDGRTVLQGHFGASQSSRISSVVIHVVLGVIALRL